MRLNVAAASKGDEEEGGSNVSLASLFVFTQWAELNNETTVSVKFPSRPAGLSGGRSLSPVTAAVVTSDFLSSRLKLQLLKGRRDEKRTRGESAANPAALKRDAPAGLTNQSAEMETPSFRRPIWSPPLEETEGNNLIIPRYLNHLLNLPPRGVVGH